MSFCGEVENQGGSAREIVFCLQITKAKNKSNQDKYQRKSLHIVICNRLGYFGDV